jgi:hypothetical protein
MILISAASALTAVGALILTYIATEENGAQKERSQFSSAIADLESPARDF